MSKPLSVFWSCTLIIVGTMMLGLGAMLFADVLVGQTPEPDCAGVYTHVQLLTQHRAKVEADLANVFAEVQRLRKENAELKAKAEPKPEPKAK